MRDILWIRDALWRNGKLASITEGAPGDLIERGAGATHNIAWVAVESAPDEPVACTHAARHPTGRLLELGRQTHDRGGQRGVGAQGSIIGGAR
jgi:hypothetical protein